MAKIFLTGGSGFIGSEIVELALAQGHQVANFDLYCPRHTLHQAAWTKGDVRDLGALRAAVEAFAPDILIHLASDTDVSVTAMESFTTTLLGTDNAITVARSTHSLGKFLHISTQFAVRPGVPPRDETHLVPYTTYGEAKAETERRVRAAKLSMPWLIIRPTIIWGPNHPSFREHIFRHIANRNYLHPVTRMPILRTYGYVTNTAQQILGLSLSDEGSGERHVFYTGDATIDYDIWADAFSIGLTGKTCRRVPVWLLAMLGAIGDVMQKLQLPAPIDSGRVFRMTTSSEVDLAPTLSVTGEPLVPFSVGVKLTLNWLANG